MSAGRIVGRPRRTWRGSNEAEIRYIGMTCQNPIKLKEYITCPSICLISLFKDKIVGWLLLVPPTQYEHSGTTGIRGRISAML